MHAPFGRSSGLVMLPLYFVSTLLIGWLARRPNRGANAYLNATGSLPLWMVVASYLAANCGALEIVGLSAMAAQYGVQAFHFYWIGAIPAMVFLAVWMMPVYRRSGVRSVPEYLELRYGPRVRLLNACIVAIILLLLGGISLYAMAQILDAVLGLRFGVSMLLTAVVVLAYILLGGLRATIYNEVFQLIVMLGGLIPLGIYSFRAVHAAAMRPASASHLWTGLPLFSAHAPFDIAGITFGLGFVLSFGYWCTDFVLMQRAFTARTTEEARQVPLWAGFGKLLFSFLVVFSGLAASKFIPALGHTLRFDQALAVLMVGTYGPLMLGVGLTALAASLMSGLAANVSAFAAIWTADIYRARLRPNETERHYLRVGHLAAAVAIVLSALASYLNFFFSNLMEHMQLIFSVFGSPFWAIFLLGMSTRRTSAAGAVTGFLSGACVGILHLIAVTRGWLHYGSLMNANFHAATYTFLTALCVAWLSSRAPKTLAASGNAATLVFAWRAGLTGTKLLFGLAAALLLTSVAFNIVWR